MDWAEKSETQFFCPIHLFASLKSLKSRVKKIERNFEFFQKLRPFFQKLVRFNVNFRNFFRPVFLKKNSCAAGLSQIRRRNAKGEILSHKAVTIKDLRHSRLRPVRVSQAQSNQYGKGSLPLGGGGEVMLPANDCHNSVAQCGRLWLYFLLGIVHEARTRDEFILRSCSGRRVSLCGENPDDRVRSHRHGPQFAGWTGGVGGRKRKSGIVGLPPGCARFGGRALYPAGTGPVVRSEK
jgi:hypothetical protein